MEDVRPGFPDSLVYVFIVPAFRHEIIEVETGLFRWHAR